MVYVTGDIHGWLDIGKLTPGRWPEGAQLRRSDFLVICGDFGLLWSNPPTLEEKFFLDWLNNCPWTTLFVDGNHENYDLLDALPTGMWHGGKVGKLPGYDNILHLKRGQIFEMGAYGRWFVMGGAPSHDKEWREEGKSWWPRELPSNEEYLEALNNLERVNWQVDYVFTHDVPRSYRRHAMARNYDASREQDDSLSAFLQQVNHLIDRSRLKLWYAGHYHDDIMLRDTQHAVLYQQVVKLGALPDGHVHRHIQGVKESWMGVEGAGKHYREWLLSRCITGCTITWRSNECIKLVTDTMFGKILFHGQGDCCEVVEMRVMRLSDGAPLFHTRFELNDILRAKELFLEMAEVLSRDARRDETRVLLCCQTGVSTQEYERELSRAAEEHSLRYTFTAKPLDVAASEQERYHVVLVAPQMGYRYQDAVRAFPHATVVEIPGEVFASLDVDATFRLVFDALERGYTSRDVPRDLRVVRPIDNAKNVVVISVVNHPRFTSIGWRVFANGEVKFDGSVFKRHVDFRDIEDVLACLRLDGVNVSELDAIGITLPGIVNRGSVSLPADGVSDYDLGRALKKRYGVAVFVDNNSNAAAMGCYVSQDDYDSVLFHAQHTGMLACGEGIVVDGHLLKGRRNCAGELLPLASRLKFSADPHELVWTFEGMREVVATYVAASVCAVAPDAVFVSCALANDMDALHTELSRILPAQRIPNLVRVKDHRELIYLGELALCIHKLNHPRAHRKW